MSETGADLASGKGANDENFPVASFIIKPQHRAVVMAFYRFARKADDIADHPSETAGRKLSLLEAMRSTLADGTNGDFDAVALRQAERERGLGSEHALDLLEAFRRDVVKDRYADWGELMEYCRYSAAPVGRFVLDVHQESRDLWGPSDTLCAALQVINHLQDCAKDYRQLNRVYIPADALAANGSAVSALGDAKASPALRATLRDLAEQTMELLTLSRPFAKAVEDRRLAYEVAAIQRLAEDLTSKLLRRDPLSEVVHHRPLETLGLLALAAKDQLFGRSPRLKASPSAAGR